MKDYSQARTKHVAQLALQQMYKSKACSKRRNRSAGQTEREAQAWKRLQSQADLHDDAEQRFKTVITILAQISGVPFRGDKINTTNKLATYVQQCMTSYAQAPGATTNTLHFFASDRNSKSKLLWSQLERLHSLMGEELRSAKLTLDSKSDD